ncbi:MAG: hypothetical protein N3A38_09390 [Planctomycetota bacterium]|nr:hypothetical protein [Planctomycetota bacterium]
MKIKTALILAIASLPGIPLAGEPAPVTVVDTSSYWRLHTSFAHPVVRKGDEVVRL